MATHCSPLLRRAAHTSRAATQCIHARPLQGALVRHHASTSCSAVQYIVERGVEFYPGEAFYRWESAQGRDLAVLAASIYKQKTGQLRVLDVMSGSGVRGARYIQQADADEVWCNDGNTNAHTALVMNLCSSLSSPSRSVSPTSTPSDAGAACLDLPSHTPTESLAAASSTPVLSASKQVTAEDVPWWDSNTHRWRPEGIRQGEPTSELWEWASSTESTSSAASVNSSTSSSTSTNASSSSSTSTSTSTSAGVPGTDQQRRCRISHYEATRLLRSCFLRGDFYDLIDVDCFGSEGVYLGAALDTMRFGGMLYLTSTDGFSAGGRRPERALASYGAYLRPLPFANEQGLRMLIGAAVKEGASRGLVVEPLFSLYSYHGPVFRVMLRVTRGAEWHSRHYGFVGHCYIHSQSSRIGWKDIGAAWCRCDKCSGGSSSTPKPLSVSGPMWTGPLHDAAFVGEMIAEAGRRGWTGLGVELPSGSIKKTTKKNCVKPLEQLLEILHEESDPKLPPWFLPTDMIARKAGACPSKPALIAALRQRGFAAARCHLEDSAIRTNASMKEVVQACQEDLGIAHRPKKSAIEAAAAN